MSLTVLCVLRSGGDYRPEHVERLRDQLAAVAPDWPMVCLSDLEASALPCERVPLLHDWPGWWSKLELWALEPAEPVLYLDLDSTILRRPERLAALAAACPWSIMRDVYRPHGLQSSVMTWQGSAMAPAYLAARDRCAAIRGRYRGDQDWVEHCVEVGILEEPVRIQDAAPGALMSWKADIRRDGKTTDGAEILVFHGRPRPWEVPDGKHAHGR